MATYSSEIRQGLPRVPGGEPWPAGGVAASAAPIATPSIPAQVEAPAEPVTATAEATVAVPAVTDQVIAAEPMVASVAQDQAAPAPVVVSTESIPLRRGLPRVADGEPWPPEGTATVAVAAQSAAPTSVSASTATAQPSAARYAADAADAVSTDVTANDAAPISAETPQAAPQAASAFVASETPLRRGLPRTPGGEPWPAEGFAPVQAAAAVPASEAPAAEVPAVAAVQTAEQTPVAEPEQSGRGQRMGATPAPTAAETTAASTSAATPPATQAPEPAGAVAPPAAQPVAAPATKPKPKPKREPLMIRDKPLAQWMKLGILGVIGAIVAAGILVLAARGVTTLPGVPEWLERYPGEYDLPESAEPGFPWWARWSHFLNIFLMVLIIRSGLLVRQRQKPAAFFKPRRGGRKISIDLWLHTSLDVVWLVNGVVFVVLLFVSGHWMRIVPTSWEVFPNALSALLQYMTLDWPAEHGWVNYNSLQQIMYFLIVFVAAPLAAITGVRMSEWWPKDAEKLNRFYPAPLARALHFPTMLFFVMFIIVHVFLVFSTGALRNLNHMFAGTDVVNWTGFWFFALAIFLTAAGWVAARPLVLAPIASLFGKVSNR